MAALFYGQIKLRRSGLLPIAQSRDSEIGLKPLVGAVIGTFIERKPYFALLSLFDTEPRPPVTFGLVF